MTIITPRQAFMRGFEAGASDGYDALETHPRREIRDAFRYGRTTGHAARDSAKDLASAEFPEEDADRE